MGEFEERQSIYRAELLAAWRDAIAVVFGREPPESKTWTSLGESIRTLEPFMGINHSFYPVSGGMDFLGVTTSKEFGCLEFALGEGPVCVLRPRSISFGFIPLSPENSFFLIDLAPLRPTGVYETVAESEQVVEFDGRYHNHEIEARGYLEIDENGDEVPLPEDARTVVRLLHGKVLIVAKTGLWNGDTSTYDGRHGRMDVPTIRQAIEKTMAAGSDKILVRA
jgi:hypothetical protein